MQSIKIKISKLKNNNGQIEGVNKNPRIQDDAKFQKLKKSLQDFPEMLELRELVVFPLDNEFIVVGGNMRLKALNELGEKEAVCKVLPADFTPEKINEFIIKDNVSFGLWDNAELSEWDAELLNEWGFEVPEWENATESQAVDDDYQIPDTIHTDIVLGDLITFEKGGKELHRLMCGDSTDSDSVAKLMNGGKADMVFTDPPYDIDDNYSKIAFGFVHNDRHIFVMNSDKKLIDVVNNNKEIFRKFFAVDFRMARLVSNNQPMTRVDLIAEFCNGLTRFVNTFDGFSTLIECAKIHNSDYAGNHGHKQAKSPTLPSKFIEHYTNENETVLDVFLGSGSTMVAAHQLNRKCYGVELDEKYCQVIIDRMINLDNNLNIKINGNEYHRKQNTLG